MSKHVQFGLAFLFFAALSTTATPHSGLSTRLVGHSYDLDLADGGTQPATLVFSSINEADGTFQASLRRPGASPVQVNGRFTLIPEATLPGTNYRVPQHYRMDLPSVPQAYWWVSSTSRVQLTYIRNRQGKC